MARTSARGGPQTRARIAEAAARLFLEHGFDAVTVAQIGREAGVSSVTVFNHFPRKEDLFLDRSAEAEALVHHAVRARTSDVLTALRSMTDDLITARHPLSGLDELSVPFFVTVARSPALVSRAREIADELQRTLRDELERDDRFTGDAELLSAFFLAGYAAVLVGTARRRIAGASVDEVEQDHRARVARLFDALGHGVPS
jgi:AcrR family transcriptional regulator